MKKRINKLIGFIILFLSFFLIASSFWLVNTFGNVTMEEIIFNMKVPLVGTDMSFVYSFLLRVVLFTIIATIIAYIIILKNQENEIEIYFRFKTKKIKKIIFPFNNMFRVFILVFIFLLSILFTIKTLNINEYISDQLGKSTLIEDEYVDPKNVEITFQSEKRNLIYIFLESMEASYTSIDNGGIEENNLIEKLNDLANENISFSNGDKLGGAISVSGTTWTVGAMVAQTSGLPLKIGIDGNKYGDYNTFLPGAYTLGDLLKENGYNQEVMFGSDATYGGRDHYFKEHGNYKIWDLNTAIDIGKMSEEDKVWWGFEDKNLFEWAKEEIINLSKEDKPFNFTMLTADTHFEDGYLSEYCNAKYEDQYSSVISCSSDLIYEFVKWIQNQDFYENTTIVIAGDHLTMDTDFFEGIDSSYERTIYNTFINSVVTAENKNNRLFTTMDLFPTTLAAMGVKIEGNRLGIGTNLFSDEKTLLEKYGIKDFRNELSKTSSFYNKNFVYKK